MSPTIINGRALGVAHNGVFDDANTDPIPGGRLWPEAALTWNAMRADFVADGGSPDAFRPTGRRSSARTLQAQRELLAESAPGKAAPVGTSNHGWGIAVDTPVAQVQRWIMSNGPRYGWSHAEGARVGEPHHFVYVGASKLTLFKLRSDAFAGFTSAERRWLREYDRLVRAHSDPQRRGVLRRVMTAQRKRIWKVAQPAAHGGDGKGWTRMRRRRYGALLARTH